MYQNIIPNSIGELIESRNFSGTLEGLKHKPNYEKLLENPLLRFSGLYMEQCPPLLVRLQLFNNGEPLGLPVTTSYRSFTKRYKSVENIYINKCLSQCQQGSSKIK